MLYEWDGVEPLATREGFTQVLDGEDRIIGTTATVGPFAWVDLSRSGNPRFAFHIYAVGNYRDLEFRIDYGSLGSVSMDVISMETSRDTEPLDYSYVTSVHTIYLSRSKGLYARVRSIKNNGDGQVTISGRAPSTIRPIPEVAVTVDKEVSEGG